MSNDLIKEAEIRLVNNYFSNTFTKQIVSDLVSEVKRLRESLKDLELICEADEKRLKEQIKMLQAYVSRLEAAFLDAYQDTVFIEKPNATFEYAQQKAREDLERIRHAEEIHG